jgi:hypothetical protein
MLLPRLRCKTRERCECKVVPVYKRYVELPLRSHEHAAAIAPVSIKMRLTKDDRVHVIGICSKVLEAITSMDARQGRNVKRIWRSLNIGAKPDNCLEDIRRKLTRVA